MTTERYITALELAELMGVSLRTIQRFTAAGMPVESWGMRNVRRYRASEALAWARGPGGRMGSPDGVGEAPTGGHPPQLKG
jgi:phage terminase Nu1 subunit (DNA packaging protein)